MRAADGLSSGDMSFAFGGAASTATQEVARAAPAPKALSAQEMEATEGEILGAIARAVSRAISSSKAGSSGGPGAGKSFSNEVKSQASTNRCVFCGGKPVSSSTPQPDRRHIDHAIPRSRGGTNTLSNAQNTCQSCNLSNGSRTAQEFSNRSRPR